MKTGSFNQANKITSILGFPQTTGITFIVEVTKFTVMQEGRGDKSFYRALYEMINFLKQSGYDIWKGVNGIELTALYFESNE